MFSKNDEETSGGPAVERPRQEWSLATRLAALFAAGSITLISFATLTLYLGAKRSLETDDDELLIARIHLLRRTLRDERVDAEAVMRLEAKLEVDDPQGIQEFIRLLDQHGRIEVETLGMKNTLPPRVFPNAVPENGDPRHGFNVNVPSGRTYRLMAAQARVGSSTDETDILQLGVDWTSDEQALLRFRRYIALVLGTTILFAPLISYLLVRRGIRPLEEMSEVAHSVGASTLHERIKQSGLPAELATLARTFNDMLGRLESSFFRLSRFSEDIAHELRTPVNNLLGEAEVALAQARTVEEYREVLSSSLEEYQKLSSLIESLLFLARAENPGSQVNREWLYVERELEVVHEFYEAMAAEKGVSFVLKSNGAGVANLDKTLFHRALANLIENAIAHTAAGGCITLHAVQDDSWLRVKICDTGCGIAEEDLPYVFDRFYRVDRARSSSSEHVGLGLAIAKSIALLHGGTAEISSRLGVGTEVILLFPRITET